MKVIHKYMMGVVGHNSVVEIDMPKGAKILDIQIQHNQPVIWAVVNPKHKEHKHTYHVFGTGSEMTDYDKKHYEYVRTVQENIDGAILVWHIFEVHE